MKNIVDYANVLKGYNKIEDLPEDVLKEAKRLVSQTSRSLVT